MAKYRVFLKVKTKQPLRVPGDQNHYQMGFALQRESKPEKDAKILGPWRRVLPDFDNEFAVFRFITGDTLQFLIEFEDLSTNDNLNPSADPGGFVATSDTPFRNYCSLSTRATEGPLQVQGNSPFQREEQLRAGSCCFFEKLPGPEKTVLYYRTCWDFGEGPIYKLKFENPGNYSLTIDMFANVAEYAGVKRYLVDPELVVRDG